MAENPAQIGQTPPSIEQRLAAVEAENAALRRQLAAMKGQVTKARARATAVLDAGKPRPIGAQANTLAPGELLAAIEAAETVEVAFSDGRREIRGVAPVRIDGDAWREITAGLQLRGVPLEIHGPPAGEPPRKLAGYGLVLDGRQAAWGARPEVLAVGGGQTRNLTDDVVFQRPVPKPAEEAA